MAARPATRSTASDGATPASPRVRDLRRPSTGPIVEWDVRTAYDFVFALSDDAGSTDDLPQADRTWLAEGKAELKARLGAATDLYGKELCVVLAGLAVDRPEVTDAASLVELLGRVPDDTVVRMILGEDLRDPERGETAERAMTGDAEAIEAMLDHLDGHADDHAKQLAVSLYRDPRSLIDPAIAVLTAWLPTFQSIEARVDTMIRRDHESRADDRATLDAYALIERTTGGIRWLSEPGVRRVILAPSYFARPYNFLLGSADWRLFGYPISDAAIDAADPFAPPPSVIRLHRALGDETRLRILRLLRDRDLYLTEIAQELELSKPTIKHHLALLRVRRAGDDHRVRLRHLLQPPPDAPRRRLGRDQAVPARLSRAGTRSPDHPIRALRADAMPHELDRCLTGGRERCSSGHSGSTTRRRSGSVSPRGSAWSGTSGPRGRPSARSTTTPCGVPRGRRPDRERGRRPRPSRGTAASSPSPGRRRRAPASGVNVAAQTGSRTKASVITAAMAAE